MSARTLAVLFGAGLIACTGGGRSDRFLHAHGPITPRMQNLGNGREVRALLERFMPAFYVAPNGFRPVDFYREYLPHTVVRNGVAGGRVESAAPDREFLKTIANQSRYYLDFTGDATKARRDDQGRKSIAYARAYRDRLQTIDREYELLFLKYSLAFPFSGLPARMGPARRLFAGILGDTEAWHELDIHGAVYVVLSADSLRPVGMILSQHHYHRVLLAGRDFAWPADDRVAVSFALHSNEPYLIQPEARSRYERVVGDNTDLGWLFARDDNAPIGAAWDLVVTPADGALLVQPTIEILAPDDPLYTARISLGDRMRLFGVFPSTFRSGPHGIDCYAPSELVNLADLMAFWDMDPRDDRLFELLRSHLRSNSDYELDPILKHQRVRMAMTLAHLDPK